MPTQSGLVHLVVFTLNDDYSVDTSAVLKSAEAAMSAKGSEPVGDGSMINPAVHMGVGKHRLVEASWDTDDKGVMHSLADASMPAGP